MKTSLGARIGQKTLEGESKTHLNTEVRSVSMSPFGTFGVPNGTLRVLNWPLLGFGPTAFRWRI